MTVDKFWRHVSSKTKNLNINQSDLESKLLLNVTKSLQTNFPQTSELENLRKRVVSNDFEISGIKKKIKISDEMLNGVQQSVKNCVEKNVLSETEQNIKDILFNTASEEHRHIRDELQILISENLEKINSLQKMLNEHSQNDSNIQAINDINLRIDLLKNQILEFSTKFENYPSKSVLEKMESDLKKAIDFNLKIDLLEKSVKDFQNHTTNKFELLTNQNVQKLEAVNNKTGECIQGITDLKHYFDKIKEKFDKILNNDNEKTQLKAFQENIKRLQSEISLLRTETENLKNLDQKNIKSELSHDLEIKYDAKHKQLQEFENELKLKVETIDSIVKAIRSHEKLIQEHFEKDDLTIKDFKKSLDEYMEKVKKIEELFSSSNSNVDKDKIFEKIANVKTELTNTLNTKIEGLKNIDHNNVRSDLLDSIEEKFNTERTLLQKFENDLKSKVEKIDDIVKAIGSHEKLIQEHFQTDHITIKDLGNSLGKYMEKVNIIEKQSNANMNEDKIYKKILDVKSEIKNDLQNTLDTEGISKNIEDRLLVTLKDTFSTESSQIKTFNENLEKSAKAIVNMENLMKGLEDEIKNHTTQNILELNKAKTDFESKLKNVETQFYSLNISQTFALLRADLKTRTENLADSLEDHLKEFNDFKSEVRTNAISVISDLGNKIKQIQNLVDSYVTLIKENEKQNKDQGDRIVIIEKKVQDSSILEEKIKGIQTDLRESVTNKELQLSQNINKFEMTFQKQLDVIKTSLTTLQNSLNSSEEKIKRHTAKIKTAEQKLSDLKNPEKIYGYLPLTFFGSYLKGKNKFFINSINLEDYYFPLEEAIVDSANFQPKSIVMVVTDNKTSNVRVYNNQDILGIKLHQNDLISFEREFNSTDNSFHVGILLKYNLLKS